MRRYLIEHIASEEIAVISIASEEIKRKKANENIVIKNISNEKVFEFFAMFRFVPI